MSARSEMLQSILDDLQNTRETEDFDAVSEEYIFVEAMSDIEFDATIVNPINLILELVG